MRWRAGPAWAVGRIAQTLAGESGFADRDSGLDLFGPHLQHLGVAKAEALYKRICRDLFHGQGGLEVWELKNCGEIGLRVSAAGHRKSPYFAVINIGDVPSFLKHLTEHGDFDVKEDRFSGSLFDEIDRPDSPISMLVGAKRFIEGWSSWRVSSMGLLNVGKGEGSQVIQLFGRGVRLKGRNMSLRRSAGVQSSGVPDGLIHLETLYIFGWNADYMQIFRDMLDREELPRDLPLLKVRHQEPWPDWLYVPVRPAGCEWKAETWVLDDSGPNVTLDLRPEVAAVSGEGGKPVALSGVTGEAVRISFDAQPYADLVDVAALHRDLVEHKAVRGTGNIFIPQEAVRPVLERRCEVAMLREDARDPALVQAAAGQALKSYFDRFARQVERDYDGAHAVPGFVDRGSQVVREYQVTVYGTDEGSALLKEIETVLKQPVEEIIKTNDPALPRLYVDWHLFNPLLVESSREGWKEHVSIAPPALGAAERLLVDDLHTFWKAHYATPAYRDADVCLLRNLPKVGVGLFHGSGFYPDFILWLRRRGRRGVSVMFIDPHGLHHGGLRGNEDRFLALKKLAEMTASAPFKKRGVKLDGRILAPADTPLRDIPDAGKRAWADLERDYPLLRQTGPYVDRLMAAV